MIASLRKRMLVMIGLMAFCSLAGFFVLIANFHAAARQLKETALERASTHLVTQAQDLGADLRVMEQMAEDLASAGGVLGELKRDVGSDPTDIIRRFLVDAFSRAPLAVGGGLWYEPYEFGPRHKYFGPYVYWDDGEVVFTWDLSRPAYDYPNQDWYRRGMPVNRDADPDSTRPQWTDPYVDQAGTAALMITVSALMRDSGGRITGLATVDFSLADLQDMIGRMRMTPGTQAAAVDRSSGRIIAYSADPNLVMDEPDALPWGDQLNLERNYPPGRAVRSDVQYGEGAYFLFSAPADADILLALLVPRSELFAKIHRIRDSAYWVLAVVVAALLLLTAAIVHLAGKHVVGPIVRATATARSIAAGDLRAAARDLDGRAERPGLSRDEIGQLSVSFATMTERLNHLIGDLQETGGMINTSSGDIGRAAGRIEADMSRQEEAAREVTDFSERISENSRRLAHNMRSAGGAVEETAGLADEGRRRISRMYDGLNDVLNASTALNRRLGAVGAKTANINRIVTTITKVADQINLLSLNAAIESEKAGEQGRGFAVVAREIRRLADQASIAVWDIEDTLKKTSDAIEAGMTETDRFTSQVKEGVQEINEIGRQLEAIIERVQNLPAQIQGLNRDVEDQAGQAQRAGAALVELTDLTQDITARMRGFMEVAGRLREVARNLDDQISEFKVESQDTGEE